MIDVAEHDLKTILNLLNRHVPECEVRAFGSRVTWTAKDHSDLDLVVVGSAKLKKGRLENLKDALQESSLPFIVDIMDWHRISAEFQKNIEKSFAVVKKPASQKKNGWKYYKVSDFAEVIGGGTPKTGVAEYWNGDIPWITPKDLSSYQARRIVRGERNISKEGLKNSSARVVPANTVLLTSRAPVGYLAIAQNDVATNQGFRNLVVKQGFSPEFVYYLLLNNVDYLKQHASGSTFQELSGGTLKNLEFQIPEYATQKQIAKILGDLDEKIELNNRMNKTLEAIAQAIFKKWFVDFEFPGHEKIKFVNGLPERWREGVLDDFVTFVVDNRGKTPPVVERSEGTYPLIEVNALINSPIAAQSHFAKKFVDEETYNTWFRKGHPKRGDILFSTVGSIGEIALSFNEKLCIAQNLIALRTNTKGIFLYLTLKAVKEDLMALDISSVQPSIKVPHLLKYKIMHPSEDAIQEFETAVEPLFNIVFNNEEENRKLSQIRDFLLPKLMAGEVAA